MYSSDKTKTIPLIVTNVNPFGEKISVPKIYSLALAYLFQLGFIPTLNNYVYNQFLYWMYYRLPGIGVFKFKDKIYE